jgi:hypothetical protein
MEQMLQDSYKVWCDEEIKRKNDFLSKRKSIHRKLSKLMDDFEDICQQEIAMLHQTYKVASNMDQANEIYVERMCKALYAIDEKFESKTPPEIEDINQYYFDELSCAIDSYKCRHVLCIDPTTGKRYCGPCNDDTCKPAYLEMAVIMKHHISFILDLF